MTKNSINWLGWVGVLAILTAYGLLSFSALSANSAAFQLLNAVGSILIIFETATKKDYQPMTLNIVWATIAVISLLRAIL